MRALILVAGAALAVAACTAEEADDNEVIITNDATGEVQALKRPNQKTGRLCPDGTPEVEGRSCSLPTVNEETR